MSNLNVDEIIRQSPLGIPRFSHLTKDTPEGLILEFGVSDGGSLKELARVAKQFNRKVYGFDWFYGLPEEWGPNGKGAFTTNGQIPNFEDNVEIVNGLFQDTLPEFLNTHLGLIAFVHIDCDTYSSASFVLEHIEKRFQPGTILAFDELIDFHENFSENNYGHWKNSEYKAFCEMLERTHVSWECLGLQACHQIAIRINKV